MKTGASFLFFSFFSFLLFFFPSTMVTKAKILEYEDTKALTQAHEIQQWKAWVVFRSVTCEKSTVIQTIHFKNWNMRGDLSLTV